MRRLRGAVTDLVKGLPQSPASWQPLPPAEGQPFEIRYALQLDIDGLVRASEPLFTNEQNVPAGAFLLPFVEDHR